MRRVIKLGGSLLGRHDLVERLHQWILAQDNASDQNSPTFSSGSENLIVIGGGDVVNAVRRLDNIRPGDAETIHWLCVDLLHTTFDLVSGWFPGWIKLSTGTEFRRACDVGFSTTAATLVDVRCFYDADSDAKLPLDWRTTTDAIAALLAIQVDADELVLLKSCEIEQSATVDELSAAGIVDETLQSLASSVRGIRVEQF